jgi:threonine/homoserine/homoserine lactone efflux protein
MPLTGTGSKDCLDWFARGFLTNILNPKVGVFYLSLLPQFIPSGVRVLPFSMLLAFIHATQGILWFLAPQLRYGFSLALAAASGNATALDRATGVVFVGFGLKLALDRRG